jgi:hypothetical protein
MSRRPHFNFLAILRPEEEHLGRHLHGKLVAGRLPGEIDSLENPALPIARKLKSASASGGMQCHHARAGMGVTAEFDVDVHIDRERR